MTGAGTPSRAATIFDVARLAGVSHQTVSRVINGLPNVRPATKERVEQAMRQLRYSPSPAARALVTRRTRTIGLVAPGVVDYGPSSIAMHFGIAARAARYSVETVTTADTEPGTVRSSVEALLRQRVDAIVLIINDAPVLDLVRTMEVGVPLVASGSSAIRGPRLVSIDQYRGARAAAGHLAECGHTRILHIAGPERATDAIERIRGWRDELAARRLETVEPLHGDWTAAGGHQLAMTMDIGRSDAIFVANDQMAIGVLSALRSRGLSVPADVSVVGFDDVPEAGYLAPALTTVRQDFAALGHMMMQRLLLALEDGDVDGLATPLPTALIVRESSRIRG